mmetsp:Transcript_6432/g.11499  ORF Transcript_6432/g.11499 Transcript_6432/m.11499 type:complete len:296 (+) Transcript_6432:584-1471(+)
MGSSARGPPEVAHWKPLATCSLISLRYWTPEEASTRRLGPVVSGPKAHSFLGLKSLEVMPPSVISSSSVTMRACFLASVGLLDTLPSSIQVTSLEGMGLPFMKRRLCLLALLERHMRSLSSTCVSQQGTTGSEMMMGAPPIKSSVRSLRQISRWSSPAPAMTCSPLLVVVIWTRGSLLARRLRPSVSFLRSLACLTWTDWRTTGETEYFMTRMLWASAWVEMVPVLSRYWSTPTRPHVLPAGMSATRSTVRPIMMMVRWMLFSYRSFLPPGTKLGPMMRTFWPEAILPEKTRPKA